MLKKKIKKKIKLSKNKKQKTLTLRKIKLITTKSSFLPNKLFKKHSEFLINWFKWKVKKKRYQILAFSRLSKKRKNYVNTLSYYNNTKPTQLNYKPLNDQTNKRSDIKYNNLKHTNSLQLNYYLVSFTRLFLLNFLSNKFLYKSFILSSNLDNNKLTSLNNKLFLSKNIHTNLLPHWSFKKIINKKVLNSFSSQSFTDHIIPWYYHTLVRFIENCTGKKTIFQFYPFLNQAILVEDVLRYKRWLPRMVFYERKLGHRFFLEEALHLIHLSFYLKDPKILLSWLKAMILRISFWKTRSIFRFLKYLFHNYFRYVFTDINVLGLKIKLKGKISAAGNSRKRTIIYRVGKTSHSEVNIKVLNEFDTVNTFTGVMGLGIWVFY